MTEDESWRNGTLAQRILHMLDTELLTDCTFVVGITEKKTFQCHKFVLSQGSPVFYAMFNGELREKGDVEVEDIEPQHFRKMLEYIYSDNTELENVETALSVCYAANKYMINTLILKCIEFIKKNLNEEIVCRALEFAHLIDNADLEAESLQYLQFHTSNVLKSDSFLNAEKSTLLTILSQDNLFIASEVELFSACIRWAEAHLQDVKLTLREILGPEMLNLIRFLTMSAKEFATVVIPSKLLQLREERDIICCIATETENMPLGFNTNTETRVAFNGPKETIEIQSYSIHSRTGQFLNNHPFNFSVNVDSLIFGLQFRGLEHGKSAIEDSFEVDLLMDSKLLASAKFEGLVSYGKINEVNFKKYCLLKANTNYTLQVKYSNLNTSYVTIQGFQGEYSTNTGLKLSARYTYHTIFKIIIAKTLK